MASASGQGAASSGFNASISGSMGAAAPEAPCKTCFEDPSCWKDPQAQTAQNFISVCRIGHGVFFLGYALLLIIIIIMVWLTSNGSISGKVNAVVDTIIAVIVIVLLGLHWWMYIKGVIPECCTTEACTQEEEAGMSFRANASIGADANAGANAGARAGGNCGPAPAVGVAPTPTPAWSAYANYANSQTLPYHRGGYAPSDFYQNTYQQQY